ncbi:hypothetical protein BGL34_04115 [Fructilactobacillus lindneri]|uniref:Uncharacterized protein n=2 Tax=Fructilactobacillus lindneri TaxID=53444 RepID=A0A0R2JXC2_9LACO|nr:hypothetical protein [Fructilactobacillus lindneri]ANZ57698.1 hypothetical protein AYR60_02425 [Fructilactobacillus lindneri]ANZ58968.1 hypothetical protein AYR59_02425 [Fructilactobacillus lindneri]KRN78868.1 hypothetical protein IV52_GL001149 [Fructilactobacillus lindneri DSM 20690 = JCM 11027]POG97993.1 hypothetical protein BGL31_04640 [Fructilactobacillus lindneri]POG99047.1 hypothetical protein BGL32_06355 [Fructilactobacillus lindneri]
MDYVLVNNVVSDNQWKKIKSEFKDGENPNVISLVSAPKIGAYFGEANVNGYNVLDHLTHRKYHFGKYRFFNDVPVPSWSKIFVNRDGSISILDRCEEIGKEYLYPNTRRAVQDVRYSNEDGSLDYIEEYAFDGTLFSNLFYAENEMLEMVFYDQKQRPVVRYYLYEGVINYITVEDPKTQEVIEHYDNLPDFYNDQVKRMVTDQDTVIIYYMGVELSSLRGTKSHNVLRLSESPLDDNQKVRANLVNILYDRISTIQTVQVTQVDYDTLKMKHMPLEKVEIIDI